MSFRARIIMVVSALLLIAVYFMPFWSVTLVAPQYPDGLGMYFWVDDITGHERHDLRNINILNHYVGMSEIHPEEFWEFDVFPWVFGFLIVFGLAVAAIGKPGLLLSWIVSFLVVAIVSFIDYYYWGYQFGHDLDPQAPINIPGESYQPPLIGSKQLANITAHSWPYWGFLFISLSFLGGILAYSYDRWFRPGNTSRTKDSQNQSTQAKAKDTSHAA